MVNSASFHVSMIFSFGVKLPWMKLRTSWRFFTPTAYQDWAVGRFLTWNIQYVQKVLSFTDGSLTANKKKNTAKLKAGVGWHSCSGNVYYTQCMKITCKHFCIVFNWLTLRTCAKTKKTKLIDWIKKIKISSLRYPKKHFGEEKYKMCLYIRSHLVLYTETCMN